MAFFVSAQGFFLSKSQPKNFQSIKKVLPQSPSCLVPRPRRLREAKRVMGTRMVNGKKELLTRKVETADSNG